MRDHEAREVAYDALRDMYEEADPPLDFDHALENSEDYGPEWYSHHELSSERQQEIVDEHLDEHDLSDAQETQVIMTAIVTYGPATPDEDEDGDGQEEVTSLLTGGEKSGSKITDRGSPEENDG